PIAAAERAGLTPLTGRDLELSLLKDRWGRAQDGTGQIVMLIGEAGLGKSRLAHTLKRHVQGDPADRPGPAAPDAAVIEWRCSPHYQRTGLYPVVDYFERALRFARDGAPGARLEGLVRRLEEHDLARPDVVPLLATLLSLPPEGCSPPPRSPARQREETFRVLRELLHAHAACRPTLFIVEDLHWADATTLEFLGGHLGEGPGERLLTLLTFRPE